MTIEEGMGSTYLTFKLDHQILRSYYTLPVLESVMRLAADKLADEFIRLHGAAVLSKMSLESVAGSLSVQASQQVARSIEKVAQAVHDRPGPVTHVHVTNHSSTF
jgi:hypothetical protein